MKAVIIGAGAQGRVALDLLKSGSEFNEFEFLDDDESRWSTLLNGTAIAGALALAESYDKNKFKALIALGNPIVRKKIAERLQASSIPYMNLLHASAYIAASASLGTGNTVCAQAVLNSNAQVGNHTLINNAAIVEHDCILQDFTTVCPGASIGGRVELSEGAFICSSAIILPRLKVGKYSVVAAGSVLSKDLPDNVIAMGSPARVIAETGGDFDWRRLL